MALKLLRKEEGKPESNRFETLKVEHQTALANVQQIQEDLKHAKARASDLLQRVQALKGEEKRIEEEKRKAVADFASGTGSESTVRDLSGRLRSLEEESANLQDLLSATEGIIQTFPVKIAAAQRAVEQARRAILEATARELTEELRRLAGEKFLKLQAARGLCGWSGDIENTAREAFGPLRLAELQQAQKDVLAGLGLDDD